VDLVRLQVLQRLLQEERYPQFLHRLLLWSQRRFIGVSQLQSGQNAYGWDERRQ
jgi:hypothetical protein